MDNAIHCFEAAGLGKAPFVFVFAAWEDWSSCEFCGNSIRQKCFVKDVNGKMFHVGNECINRTGDTGLINTAKEKIRELKKKLRHERESTTILNGRLMLFGGKELQQKLIATTNYKQDFIDRFIFDRITYGGTSYKLDFCKKIMFAVDALFPFSEEAKEDYLTTFSQNKQNIFNSLETEKQRQKDEAHALVLQRQKEWEAEKEKVIESNKDIIEILSQQFQGGFVSSMLDSFKRGCKLSTFTPRQREVIQDIYGKHFGNRNSKEYKEAVEKFSKRTGN